MSYIAQHYSDAIKRNKLLSSRQEIELTKLAKAGDKKAREKLIESNYRLVISIAKKYHKSYIDFNDLVQESMTGLIKAVDKFDPSLGFKFSTYACHWIKQAALQYINEKYSDIKVPTHSRIFNSKIKDKIREIEEKKGHTPTLEELSKELNENKKKIRYTLRVNNSLINLDDSYGDENKNSFKNNIEDTSIYTQPEAAYENKELNKIINESLSLLTKKEEKIIRLRFGIDSVNDELDFSPERCKL